MERLPHLVKIEDYEPYIGAESVERIMRKARRFRDYHIAHVNSTYYLSLIHI